MSEPLVKFAFHVLQQLMKKIRNPVKTGADKKPNEKIYEQSYNKSFKIKFQKKRRKINCAKIFSLW